MGYILDTAHPGCGAVALHRFRDALTVSQAAQQEDLLAHCPPG